MLPDFIESTSLRSLKPAYVTGLSHRRFATVLGVSPATLARWENGQRKPTGAARSLLKIAKHRPDVFRDVFARREDGFGRKFVRRKGKIRRSANLEF
jgi:transcriptional regulator with XRE-family HTH domain